MGFFWNRKKKDEEPPKASKKVVVKAEYEEEVVEEAVEEAADIGSALEKAERSMDEGLKRLQEAFKEMQSEIHQIAKVNRDE